jgi:hypothetical protein
VRFGLVLCGLLGQVRFNQVRIGRVRYGSLWQVWLVRCDMVRTGWVFPAGSVRFGVACSGGVGCGPTWQAR